DVADDGDHHEGQQQPDVVAAERLAAVLAVVDLLEEAVEQPAFSAAGATADEAADVRRSLAFRRRSHASLRCWRDASGRSESGWASPVWSLPMRGGRCLERPLCGLVPC